MEMLFLLFLCGFAIATLIFWPLLNRANKRAEQARSTPRGRHALDAAPAPAPTPTDTSQTASTTDTAKPAEGEKSDEDEPTKQGESTQPMAIIASPREPEPFEMPELPTDLFEKRYAAKFNRSKRRLDRLRSEINQID